MREMLENCVRCGAPIQQAKTGNTRRYCAECAKQVRRELSRKSEKRRRDAARLVREAKKEAQKKAEAAKQQTVTHCKGCIYWHGLNSDRGIRCCNYCIDTGKLRGIPAAECYKHAGTPYTPKGGKNAEV